MVKVLDEEHEGSKAPYFLLQVRTNLNFAKISLQQKWWDFEVFFILQARNRVKEQWQYLMV